MNDNDQTPLPVLRAAAHRKALMTLKSLHEAEFAEIHADIKREMGIPIVRHMRTRTERIADLEQQIAILRGEAGH